MESIGNLAGGIAHDFNNILSAIIGYSEMAESELPVESCARRDVQMVLKAADRAKELVKQILTFSRKNSQEKKPVRIVAVVKEAMQMIRSSLPSSIEIRFNCDLRDEMVLADPTEVHQITVNLCTNAFHAMKDQMGTLQTSLRLEDVASGKVSTEWQASSGTYVVLTVEDSGYGMEEKILERIFEPYFTTKERSEGTGLGLAVVHGIVKACMGFIEIESEIGKGSRFSVYLPLAIQDLPKVMHESKSRSLPTGHEHILFIDDEISLCEIGKQSLERLGYHVTAMSGSKEALEVFRADPDSFDLIVSDQTMPKMTGSYLALEIFRLRPKMPFIICTGYTSSITKEEALAIGIHRLIEKPVTISLLANTVRKALDERNGSSK